MLKRLHWDKTVPKKTPLMSIKRIMTESQPIVNDELLLPIDNEQEGAMSQIDGGAQVAPAFDMLGDETFAFGAKKKKKSKESRSTAPVEVFVDGSGQIFHKGTVHSYEMLLDRIKSYIDDKNPDLQGSKRYTIKPPQLARVGSKKVAWINFQEICRIMQRSADHVLQFVLAELGTEGSIGGDGQLTLKGKFGPKHIESLLRKYITEYVTCSMCKSPNTTLTRDSSTRLYNIDCAACGASRSVTTIKSGFHAVSRADRRKAKQTETDIRNMIILNVAEKPSVAREIVNHLASNTQRHYVTSCSKYNPVIKFNYSFNNQPCEMIVTSVRGHLMQLEFPEIYHSWNTTDPSVLFTAPLHKRIVSDCVPIANTLKFYAKTASCVVLWLDCDREGENIAYEVIDICKDMNPHLLIFRAHFSALTSEDLLYAWTHLTEPNKSLSTAVECRQELDLRIGAVFTRYLTLRYQKQFHLQTQILSFGPCQFPTLGFIVERYFRHTEFISENYWNLKISYTLDPQDITQATSRTTIPSSIDFIWDRGPLYDKDVVMGFKDLCTTSLTASIQQIQDRMITKHKPLPLTTTQLTIMATQKLHMTSKQAMTVAESLYQRGIISYPRTETDCFIESIHIKDLIALQKEHPVWGEFAIDLTENHQFKPPYSGTHNDHAHPPIHPVKSCVQSEFNSMEEWRLYEFISRHFLACCSDDAKGKQTYTTIQLAGEQFYASGIVITEQNFLTIYGFYDQWSVKEIPILHFHTVLTHGTVHIIQGSTQPPPLLTEADLIKKMAKFGIGTDATMHEHIQTIQERSYAYKNKQHRFQPTELGQSLVCGFKAYNENWMDVSQPHFRAEMEQNLSLIASGHTTKDSVIHKCVQLMEKILMTISSNPIKFDTIMKQYLHPSSHIIHLTNNNIEDIYHIDSNTIEYELRVVCRCRCGSFMDIRTRSYNKKDQCIQRHQRSTYYSNKKNFKKNTYETRKEIVPPRYLVCSNPTCIRLPLPKNGTFKSYHHLCPICGYQVLQVYNSTTQSHHFLCPYCFSNPPHSPNDANNHHLIKQEIPDIEDRKSSTFKDSQLRCFLCLHPTCALAKGRTPQ